MTSVSVKEESLNLLREWYDILSLESGQYPDIEAFGTPEKIMSDEKWRFFIEKVIRLSTRTTDVVLDDPVLLFLSAVIHLYSSIYRVIPVVGPMVIKDEDFWRQNNLRELRVLKGRFDSMSRKEFLCELRKALGITEEG